MSVMEEVILTQAKNALCLQKRGAFSFSLDIKVIGLKRNQLYTPTVHQLSPHHRLKISSSSSLELSGGQAARIWKSQGK